MALVTAANLRSSSDSSMGEIRIAAVVGETSGERAAINFMMHIFNSARNRTLLPQWPRIARYRETISAIPPYYALCGFGVSTWPMGVQYPLPLF